MILEIWILKITVFRNVISVLYNKVKHNPVYLYLYYLK